jgi:hypothetical protein
MSMSEFLNSDPHHIVDPLPFFYSLSLSPAPLSGVPAQRPSFAPTAFRPPCTGAPNAASSVSRPYDLEQVRRQAAEVMPTVERCAGRQAARTGGAKTAP